MITSTKAFLLAGASALAILASAADANAETFAFTGAEQSFTASVSGEYAVELLGASGANNGRVSGGLGAEVSGDVFLTAGEQLTLFVGGQGESVSTAGGGGGGSFVFLGTDVLAVAGGGGGAARNSAGGPGLAGTSGATGTGSEGGTGGVDGTGGGGGGLGVMGGGGGGAGVNTGPAGYGGDGSDPGVIGGLGGKFPNGGGGGGSGFSGGGGGADTFGGGGGGSYLKSLFTDQVLTAGMKSGDGSISITSLTPAVPEPSTWAMMLAGFAGLGWFAHTRRRKTSPA
jgi:PEP-CTERM motif